MLRKNEPSRKLWLNGFNDVLELRTFATKPDIPVGLADLPALRDYYQKAAETQNAELLEVEIRTVCAVKAIRITMRQKAKPTGYMFVSSLALPFKNGSFVLKIQALETITREDLSPNTDVNYPAHGLTRVRSELTRLEQSIQLEPSVLREVGFMKKPFWKFW
ncbi:MAG: hypothetical protein RLZZ156_701 [Deinococcota bacterium]|jgi:hypothetical protein